MKRVLCTLAWISISASAFAQDELPPPPAADTPAAGTAPSDADLAARATIDGLNLVVPGELPRRIALPCAPTFHASVGARLVVACQDRVITLAFRAGQPELSADRRVGSPVTGSHLVAEELWLELSDGSAVAASTVATPEPLVAASSVQQPTEIPPPPPTNTTPAVPRNATVPLEIARGQATEVTADTVVIDVGEDQGLEVGMTVVFRSSEQDEAGWASRQQVVGEVDAVQASRARVRIGWGEIVRVGDEAFPSSVGPTRRLAGPPQSDRAWTVRINLHTLVPTDNLGISLAVEGFARRRIRKIGFVGIHVRPTGFSVASGNNFGFGGGYIMAGVSTRLFGVGSGVGIESTFLNRFFGGSSGGYRPYVTFPTRLRIGSEDGVFWSLTTLIAFAEEQMQFLGVETEFQFPIVSGSWLFFEGSGGRLPTWHTIMGVRHRLSGNGGPGSLLLRVGLGVAGITDFSPGGLLIGPSVSAGIEARY